MTADVGAVLYVLGMCLVALLYIFRKRIFKKGSQLSILEVERKVAYWLTGALVLGGILLFVYEILK